MNTDPTQDPQAAAVEQLERFGLSSYAARTFVALAVETPRWLVGDSEFDTLA